ncbi:MAG: Glu/Leu/Phe/Val family dehydrogenase [Desulfobaccales bacterium]
MADILRFADKLGPAKIIQVYEPSIDLKAVLVIDNIAMGPAIGGIRMAPDVSIEECVRLARTMTLKNAAAGLSHGGGKTVVYADPKVSKSGKERLIRALAAALKNFPEYIMGPDMGTDEECMAWIKDEINHSVTGLPAEAGGIPIDQIGATAWGIRHAIEVALPYCRCPVGFGLAGARVAIQGFGAVGMNAARFLGEQKAVLVGAADSQGSVYDADGLEVNQLIRLKEAGKSVVDYSGGEKFDRDAIVGFECDIWIPAARPDVVTEANMERLRAKLVVEGANIPVSEGAEKYLHEKGVLCVPDFIANSGGVICAAMEYRGKVESEAMDVIEKKVRTNTRLVLEESRIKNITPREAAMNLAVTRVEKAMSYKRWSIY